MARFRLIPLITGKSINHVVVGMAYNAGEKQLDDVLTGIFIGRDKEEVNRLVLREINANAAQRASVFRFKKAYATLEEWLKEWHYITYFESETEEVSSTF